MSPIPDTDLTRRVIGCAIEAHRHLGPGLLENVYETCLCDEMEAAGLRFARQRPLPVVYKGRTLDMTFKLDIVVEESLALEIKAVHQEHPINEAQLRTYLRMSGLQLGLLMNFNTIRLKDGICRIINTVTSHPMAMAD